MINFGRLRPWCIGLLAGLGLALVMLFPAHDARAWGLMNRTEALTQTDSPHLEKRRQGYGRLADVGTMDDIPLLLAALRDEEAIIRGVAEQSIWGIWMRANDTSVDHSFQVGLSLVEQKEYLQARAKLTEVVEQRPDFAEGWHRRGEVFVLLDDWDSAFRDFQQALSLNPNHFGALEGMGHCRLNRGDPKAAADYFRRAIELNPNLWDVYEALERAQARLEQNQT